MAAAHNIEARCNEKANNFGYKVAFGSLDKSASINLGSRLQPALAAA